MIILIVVFHFSPGKRYYKKIEKGSILKDDKSNDKDVLITTTYDKQGIDESKKSDTEIQSKTIVIKEKKKI